jgi:hypothetical protein
MNDRGTRHAAGRFATLAAWAALLIALPALPAAGAEPTEVTWTGVERVYAFADVHGAYEELTTLLRSAGLLDADLRWSGGRAHLVGTGDLLDRGADSRKVMDLLMRLQGEARAAGGRVHVVLGNHEAMNVLGDLRYVDKGEYAAYANDEDPAERVRERDAFLARHPERSAADFDQLFPPGWFGQRQMLGADGPYGRWLLSLPVAIRINDTVYMHAGPSSLLAGRSLEQLSGDYRTALREYLDAEATLDAAGLLQIEDAYARRPDAAAARLANLPPAEAAKLAPAVERFRAVDDAPLLSARGPNWYRGAALCNECAEADVLRPWLQQVGARRVVIGHTVARNFTAVTRFDGAVVKLDTGMNRAAYRGRPALLVTDATGSRVRYVLPDVAPAAIPAEPLYLSSETVAEDAVAEMLASGSVTARETCAPGVMTVTVTLGGRSVEAVFEAADTEVVQRELAAYRVDRLLGLGLVPATVARSYGGRDGILQARPEHWASEQDRQNARDGTRAGLACQTLTGPPQAEPARRALPPDGRAPQLPAGGYCDLPAQFQLSYVFDALIDNRGRSRDRFLFDVDGGALLLAGHGTAFGTATKLSAALEPSLAKTGPEMQARLRRLDTANVGAAIGELVGPRAVAALLERRDRILSLAAPASR